MSSSTLVLGKGFLEHLATPFRSRDVYDDIIAGPKHETHESGAKRSSDANGTAYGLICPAALRLVAERYRLGEKTYGPYNWCKGLSIVDTVNHLKRHLDIALCGGDTEGPPEVHFAAAAWGIFTIMHFITGCKHDLELQKLEEKGKLNWRQE